MRILKHSTMWATLTLSALAFAEDKQALYTGEDALLIRVLDQKQLIVYSRSELESVNLVDRSGPENKSIPLSATTTASETYKYGYFAPKDLNFAHGQEFGFDAYEISSKTKIFTNLTLVDDVTSKVAEITRRELPSEGQVEVLMADRSNGLFNLDIYSRRPLVNVHVGIDGKSFNSTNTISTTSKIFSVYRSSQIITFKAGSFVDVWARTPEGTEIAERFEMVINDDEKRLPFRHRIEKSKEQVAKEDAKRIAEMPKTSTAGQSPFVVRTVDLINQYRASRGLNALIYDPSLAFYDTSNHAVYYSKGLAVSGAGAWGQGGLSPEGLVQMWQNSPLHNAQLLKPGVNRQGLYSDGNIHNWASSP